MFKKVFLSICKIFNNDQNDTYSLYSFKTFRFENVVPNPESEVPCPRSGHRIVADSSNFYSFGGYNSSRYASTANDDWIYSLFPELWKFNFAARQWTKFPDNQSLPDYFLSNVLLLLENIVVVHGGTCVSIGTNSSNHLLTCKVSDDDSLMLEVPTTGQQPPGLCVQGLLYHNGYLFAIGGPSDGNSLTCDILRLNIKTKIWENYYLCNGTGDYEPRSRHRHEIAFDGRYVYLLGGGTGFDFRFISTFDIEKRVWFKLKTHKDNKQGYPPVRRCYGAVQISIDKRLQIFIIGGFAGERIFDDLWRLDVPAYKWTFLSWCQLPQPLYFHATAVTPEGRLYVFGGNCSIDHNNRTDCIYSAWLHIPKLSEMCWEAILHYFPYIRKYKTQELFNIGLPRHFVKRLSSERLDF